MKRSQSTTTCMWYRCAWFFLSPNAKRKLIDEAGNLLLDCEYIYERPSKTAVNLLNFALSDRDVEVREKAIELQSTLSVFSSAKDLVIALNDKEFSARKEAAVALLKINSPYVVQLLTVALKRGNTDGRTIAAAALGDLKDCRAVGPLCAALKDPNDRVRAQAVEALAWLASPDAVKPLCAALSEHIRDNYELIRIVAALGVIRDPGAVAPLASALESNYKDDEERQKILCALGDIGAPAIGELIKALKLPWVKEEEVTNELVKIGTPAIEPLIAVLKDNDHTVFHVAAKVLQSLAWQPTTTEHRVAFAVARGQYDIAAMEGLTAIGPLIAALNCRLDEDAAKALVTLGSPAVEPLIATLTKSDSDAVRSYAARALGRIGGPRSIQALTAVLKTHSFAFSKCEEAAVAALREIGDSAIEFLVASVKDSDCPVRIGALNALSEMPSERALEPLIAALNDHDRDVRAKVVVALTKMPSKRAVEPLIAALWDSEVTVRKEAACALGVIGDMRALMPLRDLAQRDTECSVEVIHQMGLLLERNANSVAKRDLNEIARLDTVVSVFRQVWTGGCWSGKAPEYVSVDCSRIRQLARQELLRRGLKA